MQRIFKNVFYLIFLLCSGLIFLEKMAYIDSNHHDAISNVSATTTQSPPNMNKVILLTYMRSGSTFTGELFNQNDDVTYWFEPLEGAYKHLYFTRTGTHPVDLSHYANGTQRVVPKVEHEYLADTLLALLDCDYARVPIETMLHQRGFGDEKGQKHSHYGACLTRRLRLQHKNITTAPQALGRCIQLHPMPCPIDMFHQCLAILQLIEKESLDLYGLGSLSTHLYSVQRRLNCISSLGSAVRGCASHIETNCSSSKTRVVKTIRLSMATVHTILQKDPTVKVIHLLRDPRGIVQSRKSIGLLSQLPRATALKRNRSPSNKKKDVLRMIAEGDVLCRKMMNDILTRRVLEKLFPGTFLEILYEDVAKDPFGSYQQIYDFVGLAPSPKVEEWIQRSSYGNETAEQNEKAFGTFRQNATATANKWQTHMNKDAMNRISADCDFLLNYLYSVGRYV